MTLRILGAGVMGLALATELSARGHAVELVDPAPRPAPCLFLVGGGHARPLLRGGNRR
ncbi:NAD(P)-binding protein [Frigidibacter mobilis]|uniref:FAD dependent oxidoreductase n=1 Tax=Frigidibacter mobilis TaxID=1335048 RepID=A0A159Z5F1_9RHOB|nr:hypothetical protein AKL17_2348 [Frigidibacter mobilis]